MTLAGLAVRNLARNRFRVALTGLAVGIAILALLLMRTVVASWENSGARAAKDRLITRHKVTFVNELPKRYVQAVRNAPHVRLATWANWFGGRDPKMERELFATLAVDSETYFAVYDDMKVPADALDTWKHDRQGAIVGDVLARKHGWRVGDTVSIVSGIYLGKAWDFKIDGIYEATAKSVDRTTFLLHYEYANDALPAENRGSVGWIASRVDDPARAADIAVGLDRLFDDADPPTLSMDEGVFNMSFLAMFSAVLQALDIVSFVILAIMTLILGNTIAMGVRERTGEYGVLSAIGFRRWHVAVWIVLESVATGLLGGALGVLLAWPFINLGLGRYADENLSVMFPQFRLDAPTALLGMAAAAALGGVAAGIPAWRAARLRIVDALRRVA